MLIIGIAMWELNRHWPIATLISVPWNRLGWCVVVTALIAPFAAIRKFGQAGTTVNPHQPEQTSALVTGGIYAWTRNPMYLGLTMVLIGWATSLGTLTPFAGPVLFVLLIEWVQIHPEEHALSVRFGKEYADYCARVNRWFGRRLRGSE
jgi:protein-S-isoprenylcysteine O-methyltransferase Ste14